MASWFGINLFQAARENCFPLLARLDSDSLNAHPFQKHTSLQTPIRQTICSGYKSSPRGTCRGLRRSSSFSFFSFSLDIIYSWNDPPPFYWREGEENAIVRLRPSFSYLLMEFLNDPLYWDDIDLFIPYIFPLPPPMTTCKNKQIYLSAYLEDITSFLLIYSGNGIRMSNPTTHQECPIIANV